MNDQILKGMDQCVAEVSPLVRKLTMETDFRFIVAVLISEAAVLLQAGISSGVLTPAQAVGFFTGGLEHALTPSPKQAAVQYIDAAANVNYGTKQ